MDLGRLVHRAQISSIAGWLIFALGLLLLLAWAGLSIAFVSDQMSRMPDSDGAWIGAAVMAVFFVPLGLIFTFKGLAGRVLRIDVHENGVAYRAGKESQTLLWNQIAAVWWEQTSQVAELGFGVDVTTMRRATTKLQPFHGPPIVVDERFPDHLNLAAYVRDAAAAAMLPAIESALGAGQRIFFGPVGVDGWGLHLPQPVPWSAIQSVHWQAFGQHAKYIVRGTDGSQLAEIASPLPNEVILQVLLGQQGKLGGSVEEKSALGDQLLASARSLIARHLPTAPQASRG